MPTNATIPLAEIDNIQDLQNEILRIRGRLKEQEQDLGDRWNKMPKEALWSAAGAILPGFLFRFLAHKSVNPIAKGLIRGAGPAGALGLLKGAINLFKKKKHA